MSSELVDLNVVSKLREKTIEIITFNDEIDEYYEQDIERIRTDDVWVERFYLHQLCDFDKALENIFICLKWRKLENVLEVTEEFFSPDIMKCGMVFLEKNHGSGNHLLWIRMKLFQSGRFSSEELKRCVQYYAELQEKEVPYKQHTIVIDFTGAGLSNMDMEVARLIIDLSWYYYPKSYDVIIMHNMGWIFTGMWSMIKGFIGDMEKLIKFTSDDQSLLELVDRNLLPPYMQTNIE